MESMRLQDRVAVITGGGQGMGKAYARRLLEEGATVVIAEIDPDRGERAAAELQDIGEVSFVQVDISDEDSTRAGADRIVAERGRIDILLNNAALYDQLDFSNHSLEYLRRVIDVNVNGTWLMSRAVVPAMVKAKSGRIINVASTTAYLHTTPMAPAEEFGGLDSYAYPMSKWSVIGLTKFMAGQLGRYNITVNTIVPGFTLTEASRKLTHADGRNDFIEASERLTPMGIAAFEPEDMAGTAVYFASDDARYVTGQLIVIDGGMISPS
ncbi:MAG: dehydrogenase [Deltaproteobacteria bacterium]|nr:dehydrogenase [Deltaproteobacteria bacterium]